jgi:hypothetical protein
MRADIPTVPVRAVLANLLEAGIGQQFKVDAVLAALVPTVMIASVGVARLWAEDQKGTKLAVPVSRVTV